jgi:CubicO group peptidase (beta-lactamase class C family)
MPKQPTPAGPPLTPLRALLSPYVARGTVPGLVALVARGDAVQLEVMGVKTVGQSEPIERDSIFRVASLTKPITAAATMLLVEDGKLRLDEPVDRLLPELAQRKVLERLESPLSRVVPARRPLTVLDLLTFRMGFGIVMAAPGTYPIQKAADDLALGQGMPAPQTPPAPDEWLRRFGRLPLMYQPGERWQYNTGADVLGVLIARASGKPFDVFLRERLFEPLAMHDTDFSVPASKRSRFTTSYLANPSGDSMTLYDAPDGQWSHPPAFPSGAAGLVSTVQDFLQFSRFLLGKGTLSGKRLLRPESVLSMTTDQLTPEVKARGALTPQFFERHGWGYCISVVTQTDEMGRAAGSFGWGGGLGTSWYADPKRNLTGVLFTNRSWSEPSEPPIFRDFWREVSAA